MSNWTYVSGSVGIEKIPYTYELNGDGSIKYQNSGKACVHFYNIEEQFKLIKTRPALFINNGEQVAGFAHTIEISSFPMIKKEIEELMKDFSSGEKDSIFYILKESNFARTSVYNFKDREDENFFHNFLMKNFPLTDSKITSWEEYISLYPTELDSENFKENAVLSIHDSIRDCDAKDFYLQLIIFFTKLTVNDYYLTHGSFMFYDAISPYDYCVDIQGADITVRIYNRVTKKSKNEFYQVFQFKDPSTSIKKYPLKFVLKKVDKLSDEMCPTLEESFF